MTLSSWHVCCELQLTPRACADYLDIEACIADPGRDPHLVDCALTSLAFADSRVQALAVPDLVGLLARGPSDDLRHRAAESILAATGPALGTGLLAGIAELTTVELAEVVAAVAVPRPDRVLAEFADLAESAAALLGLALLRQALTLEAAAEDAEENENDDTVGMLEPLVRGEDALWYLTAAATGSLGHVPQLLAVECLLLAEESASALIDLLGLHDTGPWLGQPGLVRARMLIELSARGCTEPAERATWLCAEASTLALYADRAGAARVVGLDWLRLQVPESKDAAALVLWQAVAWELAVVEDPATAAPHLAKAWAPAEPVKFDVLWLNLPGRRDALEPALEYLGRLRPRAKDRKANTQIKVGNDTERGNSPQELGLAFSPWLDRATPAYHGADKQDANLAAAAKTFPSLDDDVAVLRLVANARTQVRLSEELLRNGAEVPPALWDPFVNLLDVLANVRLREPLYAMGKGNTVPAGQRRLSPVVLTLVLAAQEHATRQAKGFLHAHVPAALQQHLTAKSDISGFMPRQQFNLYSQAALMAVAHVAWEALSGQLRSTGSASSPWLRGGATSPAARLLETLFGPVWDRLPNPAASIQTPALLLAEVLPHLAAERAPAWDWRRVYLEKPNNIGQNLVLLSPRMSLAEWDRLTLDSRRFPNGGAWMGVLTEWLVVTFREGTLVPDHPHLIAWRTEIEQINSPGTLSRALRQRLIELLGRPARSDLELEVQRLALRAILEFSAAAIRYQDGAGVAVAGVLESATGSESDGPTELATEWLYALERPVDDEGDGRGPWAVRANRALARTRRESARANVARLLDSGVPVTYTQVLDAIDSAATTPLHPVGRDDGRAHRRAVFQRRGAADLSALTPVGGDHGADQLGASLSGIPGAVLGLVAGPEDDDPHAALLLNVGAGEPHPGPLLDWATGTVVASQSGRATEIPAPAGAVGDLVEASVTWADGQLTVAPDGRQPWVCDAAHLPVWLPDSRGANVAVRLERCLVCRQPDGAWVPVVRDFVRLLVTLGSTAERQGTVIVVGESVAEDGWVVQSCVGLSIAVPNDAMTAELRDALEAVRAGDGSADRSLEGLRVRVALQVEDSRASLTLAPVGDPIDDENLRWRERFAAQRVQAAHRVGGTWEIEGEPGLAVRFTGSAGEPAADATSVRVRVRSGGWDERAQRTRVVAVAYLRDESLPVADWTDHAVLSGYLNAGAGTPLVLTELSGGSRDGYLDGVTSTGLPVSVAADSLSFLPGAPAEGLVEDRAVVVQAMIRRSYVETRQAIPITLDGVPADASVLRGLVARLTPGLDELDVWLDRGASSALVTVPTSALLTEAGTVGSRVELRRNEAGWVLAVNEIVVLARATWTLKEATAPADAVALSVSDVPGHGLRLVLQHPSQPVLFLADPADRPDRPLTCGVRATGRVTQLRRGFVKDLLGRALDVVAVGSGGDPVVGHSPRGAFKTPRPWLSASLVVLRQTDLTGAGWIDARRDFVPGRGRRSTLAPTGSHPENRVAHLGKRPVEPAEHTVVPEPVVADLSWPLGYEDWQAAGTGHAVAEWLPAERGSVRLSGLALPLDPLRPESGSTETVPEESGHRSHLRGRGYDPRNVRVRLSHNHRGWQASYRTTPLTLAQFASDVLGRGGEPAKRQRIWFAGMTDDGRYRFEWGYGWTMELELNELDLQDRRTPFFFGDCLQSLSVVRAGSGEDAPLRLRVGHVRWEVERMVHDDAEQGVLHQVRARVETGPSGRTFVNVEGVFHRNRAVQETGGLDGAAKYARMFNAEFDHESQELILDRLRGRADGPEVVTVLARLDRDHAPGVGGNRRQRFMVLTPQARGIDDERLPKAGESLVLVGRDIRRTGRGGKGNDYQLDLVLPEGTSGDKDFAVTVRRRQFSFRESTLRQAFRSDPSTYRGAPMLVKLTALDDAGGWRGSVVDAPARPWPSLRAWAETEPDRAYVVVGHQQGPSVLVEPRPGVIGRVPLSRGAAPKGSLCRLGVATGKATLAQVVPGESRYVPRAGRPVHLLLKDDAFGQNSQGGFTVAGMPGIEVYDTSAAQAAKYQRPPRLSVIAAQGERIAIKPDAPLRAGRLFTNVPHVRPFRRADLPDLAWPDLSFRDDVPKRLAAHCVRGVWHYHDTATRYVRKGKFIEEVFPDPVRSKDGPLFFDERWRLRYRTEDLLTYGYSATELLEHGLPKDDDWYPVAAPARSGGLWIETSPGRVVELSAPLLHSSAIKGSALDDLPWGLFAPGDELRLGSQHTHDATRSFVLQDWRPGPRGWFRGARALLVPTRNGGTQRLGTGLGQLTWSGTADLGTAPLWLQPDNTLTPFTDDAAAGDVVLLEHRDGTLVVHGLPGTEVVLAANWDRYAWLRDMLAAPSTAGPLLDACAALAVRVHEATDGRLIVGPAGDQPGGSVLAGRLIAVLDDEHGLFRSGSALLRLPLPDLLPGVPAHARPAAAAVLSSRRRLLWLRRTEGRWVSPALVDTRRGSFAARVVAAAPGGVLMERTADLAIGWLPLSELGRAEGDVAEQATLILRQQHRGLDLVEREPGRWSYLATHAGRLVERQLASSGELQVVPQAVLEENDGRSSTYLATVYPTVALVTVHSESALLLGEPLVAELESVGVSSYAIPRDQRRSRLHLSPWLLAALRESRQDKVIDLTVIADRAKAHTAYRDAVDSASGARLSLEERLVAAYADDLQEPGSWTEQTRADLSAWLIGPGGAVLTGSTAEAAATASAHGWDLAPQLAGIALLAAFGEQAASAAAARLAVHGVHALGQAATGAQHQEVLLRNWLLPAGPAPTWGRWVRLSRLDLGGRTIPLSTVTRTTDPYVTPGAASDEHYDGLLTRGQVEQLRRCCSGVLDGWSEPDERLTATARSLLFAAGFLPPSDDLMADLADTELARLVALSRALTPGRGVPVAQPALSPWQRGELVRRASACLGASVPLSLLPLNVPALPERSTTWAAEQIAVMLVELEN